AQRHEALLNLAFEEDHAWILCPYDTSALGTDVIADARRNHPAISVDGTPDASSDYSGLASIARPFGDPLSLPPKRRSELRFGWDQLENVRAFASRRAGKLGMPADRIPDLVLAVDEVA